jgi:hypothetical protein
MAVKWMQEAHEALYELEMDALAASRISLETADMLDSNELNQAQERVGNAPCISLRSLSLRFLQTCTHRATTHVSAPGMSGPDQETLLGLGCHSDPPWRPGSMLSWQPHLACCMSD